MNVRDLIAALQDMPQDAEVRLATQPNYPIASTIAGVVSPDALAESSSWCEDCGAHLDVMTLCPLCLPNSERMPNEVVSEEDECLDHVVWITEGGHPEDSPYAPRAVFDAVSWS